MTTEKDMVEAMTDAMYLAGMVATETFEENGVMTANEGFVVWSEDGCEFHVTVQRTR